MHVLNDHDKTALSDVACHTLKHLRISLVCPKMSVLIQLTEKGK